jgi:hypothetical protein
VDQEEVRLLVGLNMTTKATVDMEGVLNAQTRICQTRLRMSVCCGQETRRRAKIVVLLVSIKCTVVGAEWERVTTRVNNVLGRKKTSVWSVISQHRCCWADVFAMPAMRATYVLMVAVKLLPLR